MFIEPTAQVESTQVKIGLKEKIKTKYDGTELPQIEMKEPEPPKPVSKVHIYAKEMFICALYQGTCILLQGNKTRRQSEALLSASSVNRTDMQVPLCEHLALNFQLKNTSVSAHFPDLPKYFLQPLPYILKEM